MYSYIRNELCMYNYVYDSRLSVLLLSQIIDISKLHGCLLEFHVQNDSYYKHTYFILHTYVYVNYIYRTYLRTYSTYNMHTCIHRCKLTFFL